MPKKTLHNPATQTSAEPVATQDTTPQTPAPSVAAPEQKTFTPKRAIGLNDYVTVRNGFNGKLVYVSRRTNERFEWDGFGAEQEMELVELKSAKGSNKAFFENNWFMIDDPEVIAFLGLERFYKHSLTYDHFDDLFSYAPDDIEKRVALLPAGQKKTVVYRAKQLIGEGKIDSIKVITALEKSLGVELIER